MRLVVAGFVLYCSALAQGANSFSDLASSYLSTLFGVAPFGSAVKLFGADSHLAPLDPSNHGSLPPQAPPKTVNIPSLIQKAAKKHNIPEAFVRSIVAAESNFDTGAISAKGAIGLMQLMPDTAEQYGADPTIPEQNIDAGARYLRFLMDKYARSRHSLERVIAAYNAGPGKVDRYRGVPPFRETRRYVVRVLSFLRRFQKEQRTQLLARTNESDQLQPDDQIGK
jgi:hypothetical protein